MKRRPTPAADAAAVMNALRRVVRALRIWAEDSERIYGLTGAQLFVLQTLAEVPVLSFTELAERTLTTKATVSVVVKRLVARGLVRRRPSPQDGRSSLLAISAEGRRELERGPESPQSRIVAALGRMSPGDLHIFASRFDHFIAELGIRTLAPRMLFESDRAAAGADPTPTARRSP
ncbi:MAG TPA: MarR family transcriptional regulator [Gemmatimonadales bacterium]|jgi:DNA-binding MarR family transcriptional regulator